MNNDIKTMTEADFAQLLGSVNDRTDHHILWVNRAGKVFISPIGGLTPAGWEAQQTDLKFRWETFGAGNGYCGKQAASDPSYVKEKLAELKDDWTKGKTGYVDY